MSNAKILLIDNYDSFTYNLVQAFAAKGAEVLTIRNDAVTVDEARALDPTHLVISPGPGRPDGAGVSLDMIGAFAGAIPMLGVCLGHQCLVQYYGGEIVRAGRLMHGKTSMVTHDDGLLFAGMSQPFEAGRYHSLCAEDSSLPDELVVTAKTDRGEIMGVRHRTLQLEGVQFHPESVLTPEGDILMTNFMQAGTNMSTNYPAILDRLLNGESLGEGESARLMHDLASGDVEPALAGALLAGLRAKGETADEIRGFATAMRELALHPAIPDGPPTVDTVGTGGDGSGSLNLSTGTGLLAAAAGARVVKHGNRSVSSKSGSADMLECLGMPMPLDEQASIDCLEALNFTFLFAPAYHPAMKAIMPVRGALGVRTVFNILGPLANPAAPPYMLVGAFSQEMAKLMAETLSGMPIERAFVVHGEPGWDEATPAGQFVLYDVRPGSVVEQTRAPEDYGMQRCAPEDSSRWRCST